MSPLPQNGFTDFGPVQRDSPETGRRVTDGKPFAVRT